MKKILVLLLIVATIPAMATDSISAKVTKSFNETFPEAVDVKWYTTPEGSEVYYDQSGMKCHIWYDAKGRVLKTRRDYSEKELCPFIKAKVNRKYAGKKIYGVTEINDDNELSYLIILEDEKTWTKVTADTTGQLTLVNKANKS